MAQTDLFVNLVLRVLLCNQTDLLVTEDVNPLGVNGLHNALRVSVSICEDTCKLVLTANQGRLSDG